MSLPRGTPVVSLRRVLFPLIFLCGLTFAAEPGPQPREARFDSYGNLLPAGAVARLGLATPLDGFPFALAWSADGKQFVVLNVDSVVVFDSATGQVVETQQWKGLGQYGPHTPLSRDGRNLLFLSERSGSLYDIARAGVRSFTLPDSFANADRKVYSLSLSDNSRFLTGVAAPASTPGVAWRYDLARDKFTPLMKDRTDLTSVRVSPDGKRLYATGGPPDPDLTACDLGTGRELWTVPVKSAGIVRAVSPDGRRLAVTYSGGLTVFDSTNGKAVCSVAIDSDAPRGLWAIDLSQDGSQLALSDGRNLTICDVQSGKVRRRFARRSRLVAFSPDGKSLLAAGAWVQRWDLETGKSVYPEPFLDKPVGATILRWSADSKRLLTVWPGEGVTQSRPDRSDLVAVWDLAETTIVSRWRTDEPVLACMLDGQTVRCYLERKLFRTWDVEHPDRETVALLHMAGLDAQRGVGTFLRDGRFAMLWKDDESAFLHIYDRNGGLELRRPRPGPETLYGRPTTAGYRGQGTTLFGPDGSRFDLAKNRSQPSLLAHGQFRLTHLVATESSAFVAGRGTEPTSTHDHVWESMTGKIIADLPDDVPAGDRAVVSSDGRFLACLARDVVIVHDFMNPAGTVRLPAHGASALAFSPDGSRLATAQDDGTVLIWAVPRRMSPWQAPDADRLWANLISDDSRKAWWAIWQLLDHPERATELISARLPPLSAWDDTAEQISRLDHPKYPVRERAMRELAVRGRGVEEALRAVLKAARSEEQRTRAEQLLSKIDTAVAPTGEILRGLRCVWLLERIGTSEAKKLLTELANGTTWSLATIEAKAALERLK